MLFKCKYCFIFKHLDGYVLTVDFLILSINILNQVIIRLGI